MPTIKVSTVIQAPRHEVWALVRDLGAGVRWMEDAEAIRFTSPHREGKGTTFVCDTRVGPLRLADEIEVVEWKPRRAIGIRHRGLVSGRGRFVLQRRRGATRFTWEERLRFPWWMGGPLGGVVAAPVLRWQWRRNLANLKTLVESSSR